MGQWLLLLLLQPASFVEELFHRNGTNESASRIVCEASGGIVLPTVEKDSGMEWSVAPLEKRQVIFH